MWYEYFLQKASNEAYFSPKNLFKDISLVFSKITKIVIPQLVEGNGLVCRYVVAKILRFFRFVVMFSLFLHPFPFLGNLNLSKNNIIP